MFNLLSLLSKNELSESEVPEHFTVPEMIDIIKDKKFEKIYPYPNNKGEFLNEHYKILEPYREIIQFYKGQGYRPINTYYKTGQVRNLGASGPAKLELQKLFNLKTPPSGVQFIKYYIKAVEQLYEKIKPLERDYIVFRGVHNATFAQNMFTGDCVKSLYFSGEHRYCKPSEIVPAKTFSEFKEDQNPEDYIYETLGFTSTTTKFRTAEMFAGEFPGVYDTFLALRIPAGTKVIFPIKKVATSLSGPPYEFADGEYEFILFPLHNTFVLDSLLPMEISTFGANLIPVNLFCGTICNDLNMYRPKGMPKLHPLVKQPTAPKPKPTLPAPKQVASGKCTAEKIDNCKSQGKICNPVTGKCLIANKANIKKIQGAKTAPSTPQPITATPTPPSASAPSSKQQVKFRLLELDGWVAFAKTAYRVADYVILEVSHTGVYVSQKTAFGGYRFLMRSDACDLYKFEGQKMFKICLSTKQIRDTISKLKKTDGVTAVITPALFRLEVEDSSTKISLESQPTSVCNKIEGYTVSDHVFLIKFTVNPTVIRKASTSKENELFITGVSVFINDKPITITYLEKDYTVQTSTTQLSKKDVLTYFAPIGEKEASVGISSEDMVIEYRLIDFGYLQFYVNEEEH